MSDDIAGYVDAWEAMSDGRANDENLTISGFQAHDTAQAFRDAADEIERLRAEVRDRDIRLGNTERHLVAERDERIAAEAQRDRLLAAINSDTRAMFHTKQAADEVRAEMEANL